MIADQLLPNFKQALCTFATDNPIVMLICDPFHPASFAAASFFYGSVADDFLSAECISATASKDLDRVFVFSGIPFEILDLKRSGKSANIDTWLGALLTESVKRKATPAILALIHRPELRDKVEKMIADLDREERWAKFLVK